MKVATHQPIAIARSPLQTPRPPAPQGPEDPSDRYAAAAGATLGLAAAGGATVAVLRAASPLLSQPCLLAVGAGAALTLAAGLGAYAGHGAVHSPRWGEDLFQGFVSRRMRQEMVKASQADSPAGAAGHGARLGAETGALFGALAGGVVGLAGAVLAHGLTPWGVLGALAGTGAGVVVGAGAGAGSGALLGAGAGLLAGRVLPEVRKPQAVDQLDLGRYMGDWYEIARYPNVFQREPEAARQSFRLNQGKVEVTNTGFDPLKGTLRSVQGATWLPDSSQPGKFKVSFAPGAKDRQLLGEDYWVLDVAPDYGWAAVGDPTRSFLWILSREPKLDPQVEAGIRQRLAADGWDLDPLQASPAFPRS